MSDAEPQAIVAADINNDGHLDLVTANAGSNNVSVNWASERHVWSGD